jgi:cytochrome c
MRSQLILGATAAALLFALGNSPAVAADAAHGKVLFQKCAECHSGAATGDNVGPSLKGVFGRKAGALEDFRYSHAMRRSGIVWDAQNLKEYISNPQGKVRGNRMPFQGFAKPSDVDDIVAFLKTYK